ncbi:MAG: hypothetical protein SAK29_26650 [Scytonema sp. PMC 1069.18]|nr:hypothetical protein [Scytonema sp. PMC 1069.18]MEC4881880.1 hypothetical protein [Scytonema sp. PMC 1070.18]
MLKILIMTGMAVCTSFIYHFPVQAQSQYDSDKGKLETQFLQETGFLEPQLSLTLKENILIAQNLAGIEREIPLQDVPSPAMASAKTVSGADFSLARTELKPDGSLFYKVRGKNQQGFEVEVQVTSSGNIIQVDEQIDSSAVPETVVKALRRWTADAQIISTWRSTRLGEFVYQFVIPDFWVEVPTDANKVIIYRRIR